MRDEILSSYAKASASAEATEDKSADKPEDKEKEILRQNDEEKAKQISG